MSSAGKLGAGQWGVSVNLAGGKQAKVWPKNHLPSDEVVYYQEKSVWS